VDVLVLIVSALLQVVVVLIVPLEAFFGVARLSGEQWLYVVIAAFAIVPVSELVKLTKSIIRHQGGNK
jgi:hypothetical protein